MALSLSTKNSAVLWLVAMGFFMQALDATIVNTAIPAMADVLHESPLNMQAVVEAYLLTVAILIPASGWLADRFGTRRVFILSVAGFGIGSLACAMSSNLSMLIAARVLQGIGGALMMPVGRLAIFRTFPRHALLSALSFVVIPGLLGPIIGPALGGFLVEVASWHWVFLINIPVALIGVYLSYKVMPDIASPETARFDLLGYLQLALAMALLTLGLDGMTGHGVGYDSAALMLLLGSLLLACYWWYAQRVRQPIFSPALFKVQSFKLTFYGSLFNRMGTGALPLLLPLYLQVGNGFSPFKAGLSMIPIALSAMLFKRIGVGLLQYFGYRRVLMSTSVLLGLCIASFAWSDPKTMLPLLVLQLAILGALNSVTFSGMGTLSITDLNDELAGGGNSLYAVCIQLGMSLGIAIGSALLAGFTRIAPGTDGVLWSFSATFLCIGALVVLPVFFFARLTDEKEPVSCSDTQS